MISWVSTFELLNLHIDRSPSNLTGFGWLKKSGQTVDVEFIYIMEPTICLASSF